MGLEFLLELEGGGAVLGLEVEVELDGEDTEALAGLCACACYKAHKREREARDRGKAKQSHHIRTSGRIHSPHGYLSGEVVPQHTFTGTGGALELILGDLPFPVPL